MPETGADSLEALLTQVAMGNRAALMRFTGRRRVGCFRLSRRFQCAALTPSRINVSDAVPDRRRGWRTDRKR